MKQKLKSALAVFSLYFIAALPAFVLKGMAHIVAWLLWKTNSQSKRITEVNLKLCFAAMSEHDLQQMVKASLLETTKTALEMPACMLKPEQNKKRISKVSNRDLVEEAISKGRGVIIIAPHIGNWEFLGEDLAQHFPITNLYKPSKIPAINTIIKAGRRVNGSKLEPTNKKGVFNLLKNLKKGELIGILPDQIPDSDNGTVFSPFFGQSAATMTLIANFLKRTQAAAIVAMAKRLEDGTFEVIYLDVDKGIYAEDLQVSVDALNRTVEKMVLLAPAQYQWEYKRFKKGAEGRRDIY